MEIRSALENLAERVGRLESFPVPTTPPSVSIFHTFYTLHIFNIFLSIPLSPSSFGIPKLSETNSFQLYMSIEFYSVFRLMQESNWYGKYYNLDICLFHNR